MGCASSSEKPAAGATPSPAAAEMNKKSQEDTKGGGDSFRTKYNFGEELGKGGNATVMSCTEIATGKEYAVKLLETGKATIDLDQEVNMMKKMEGCPNIVQLRDVFIGTVFAYVVMDKYHGDVVHAMVAYISKNGKCPEGLVRPLFKQMVAAIAWLHQINLIHRDIKSDNYLLNDPNVASPDCTIVLSDMGTVCELEKDKYLSARVGTALYWSPEVVRKKYSYPADVWALGVILYSVTLGMFPFKGPDMLLADSEPNYSRGGTTLSKPTQEYLGQILIKKVESRLSAQATLDHAWMASKEEGASVRVHANIATKVEQSSQGKSDVLKRVEEKEKAGKKSVVNAKDLEPFETTEPDGTTFQWEWWPENQLGGMLGSRKGYAEAQNMRTLETSQWTKVSVEDLFKKHQIDTGKYGKDKANTMDQMIKELTNGESVLLQDDSANKLVRLVQVVVLRLRNVKTQELLVETHLDMGDGRKKEVNRLMGTKMKQDENLKACARRLLRDYLSMPSSDLRIFCRLHAATVTGTGGSDSVTLQCERLEEGPIESPAYPDLNTIYHKYFLDGDVDPTNLPDALKNRYGIGASGGTFTLQSQLNDTRTWAWKTQADCQTMGIATKGGKRAEEVGSTKLKDVQVADWTEDRVKKLLEKHNVDTTQYGQGKALTLAKFADEINAGQASLLENQKADLSSVGDGVKQLPLVRVCDIVALRMRCGEKPNSYVMVEASHTLTDGRILITNRLPATKMKLGETVWLVARRMVDNKLNLKDADVTIRTGFEDIVDEETESASYPGLPTLYRKHFIDAIMNPSGA